MMEISKLRKISDDLYIEESKEKNGTKLESKYERAFETLRFDLFDAQVAFSSDVDLKETQPSPVAFFKIKTASGEIVDQQPEDTRTDNISSNVRITAKSGEFENGDDIIVFDHDKQLRISRASSITIERMSQWNELLQEVRSLSKGNKLSMGHSFVYTSKEAQDGYGLCADQLILNLFMPPEQFDYIANVVTSAGSDRVTLSAVVQISAFRTEVDRALSEPWHQMTIGIERHTPAKAIQ
jgi:hypothetical protein